MTFNLILNLLNHHEECRFFIINMTTTKNIRILRSQARWLKHFCLFYGILKNKFSFLQKSFSAHLLSRLSCETSTAATTAAAAATNQYCAHAKISLLNKRASEEWKEKNSKNFIKVKKHELLNSGARRWRTLESHKRHQNNIKWNVLKYIWSSFVYFTQMRPRELAYVIHTYESHFCDLLCSSERLKVAFDNYFTLNSNVSARWIVRIWEIFN